MTNKPDSDCNMFAIDVIVLGIIQYEESNRDETGEDIDKLFKGSQAWKIGFSARQ